VSNEAGKAIIDGNSIEASGISRTTAYERMIQTAVKCRPSKAVASALNKSGEAPAPIRLPHQSREKPGSRDTLRRVKAIGAPKAK